MKFKANKLMKNVLVYGLVGTLLTGSVMTAQAAGLKDIFDAKVYSEYDDLKEAFGDDEEALYNHYVAFGFEEGRVMNDLIDVKRYREAYADLDAAFGDDWDAYVDHYLTYGFKEGRNAFGEFDARYYFDTYADLRDAFGEDALALYTHYMDYGRSEGRASAVPAPAVNYSSNNNQPGTDVEVNVPVAFSGRIVNPETGAPVANATVQVTPQGDTPVMQPTTVVIPNEETPEVEEAPEAEEATPEVATFSLRSAAPAVEDDAVAEDETVVEDETTEETPEEEVIVINPYITTTDENGFYSFNIYSGTYSLVATASDYLVLTMDTVIVNAGEASVAPTITLLSENAEGESAISGRLTNALNGEPIEGVTVELRNNWNNYTGTVAATATTDENGVYTFNTNRGYYTATYAKDGFVTKSQNVISVANYTSNIQNEALTPEMESDESYRIVLTWGETPRDLDSHLTGTSEDNDVLFHVCYWNKEFTNIDGDQVATLDYDDITSFGPETVTIITPEEGATYRYSVHNYSGEADMQLSGATVAVYEGTTLVATYNIPVTGEGMIWNVFDIVDGEIVTVNEFKSDFSDDNFYSDDMLEIENQ